MNPLHRSDRDRVVAGVAGGMAETYDVDPALVRLGWALMIVVTGGVFLVIYIVMAIVVPLDPSPAMLWQTAGAPMTTPGNDQAGGVPPGPGAPMSGPTPPIPPPPGYYGNHRQRRDSSGAMVLGVILVLVGAFFLFRQFIPTLDWGLIWPVVVIAGGALLIVAAFGRPRRTP